MRVTLDGKTFTITAETIQQTREWFAKIARDCAKGAITGEWRVNDLAAYLDWQSSLEQGSLRGDYDHSLAFIQRAVFVQTGKSVPLLS